MSGSNPLAAALSQVGQSSPFTVANNLADLSTKAQALKTSQFNLGQAQQGLGYQAMRMLQATNSDPSDADVQAALGSATRQGGIVDGLVQDYTAWRARGGTPGDFVRSRALGGMSPEAQYSQTGPQFQARQTDQGTYYGVVGGAATPNANQFLSQPGFVQRGLAPATQVGQMIVGYGADGKPIYQSVGAAYGDPYGGGGAPSAGAPATGGGGVGTSASSAVNNFGNIRAPGGGFASYATPQDGVAAMTQNLTAYQDNHGINTLNGITARWAPAGDGNNNPVAYANTISKLTGIDPNAQLDLHDPATLAKIIPAMAQVEHGRPMGVGNDVLTAGISAGLSSHPVSAVASAPASSSGPFIGAASAVPVASGGAVAQPGVGAVRPAQYFPASPGGGQYLPASPGGPGGAAPGSLLGPGQTVTGLPAGFEQVVQPQIARANQLQQGLAAGIQTRATLEGMEAELNNLPATGVPSGPLGTLRNLAVSAGLVSQQTADSMARTQSAQEQFEKFASLLQQQQLGALTGQATDERQALTAASTPSILHTKLGNLGIIHMLEGNQSALQVMGRAWQQAVSSGQASPQQFDAWRNQFTEPDKNGGRFDPRVFWMAQMGPDEQRRYGSTLTAKDKQQLERNVRYAEQHNWIHANDDGSFGTSY